MTISLHNSSQKQINFERREALTEAEWFPIRSEIFLLLYRWSSNGSSEAKLFRSQDKQYRRLHILQRGGD